MPTTSKKQTILGFHLPKPSKKQNLSKQQQKQQPRGFCCNQFQCVVTCDNSEEISHQKKNIKKRERETDTRPTNRLYP